MIALYLLWIAFCGRFAPDVLISGACICGLVGLLLRAAMGYRLRYELILIKNSIRIARYLIALMREMIFANIAVIKVILSPYIPVEGQLVFFTPGLKNEITRVLLADSITLTPGTITVQLKNGRYCVHGLKDEYVKGIESSALAAEAQRLEDTFRC